MLVSIIIPYKEDRGYLKAAMNSVPKDCQLILSQGPGNVSTNINNGIRRAKGTYIKYLNDDDMLTENCVRDSLVGLQNADFIHGNAYTLYPNKMSLFKPSIHVPTLQDMVKRNPLHGGTVMYHRKIFDKIGLFDESLLTCEEYEFNMRALKAGFKIGYVDAFLCYYRQHDKQKTQTIAESIRNIDRQKVRKLYE